MSKSVRNTTRQAQVERTRSMLRNALMELIEEKSFAEITVKELVGRAKLGWATFFRHYPDTEALLNDTVAHEVQRLLALTLPLIYTVDTRASTRALCAYISEHRKVWTALLTGGAAEMVKREYIRQARQIAADQGDFDSWLPRDLSVVFSVAALVEILSWWMEHGQKVSVERMSEIVDFLVVAPSAAVDRRIKAAPKPRRPSPPAPKTRKPQ